MAGKMESHVSQEQAGIPIFFKPCYSLEAILNLLVPCEKVCHFSQ